VTASLPIVIKCAKRISSISGIVTSTTCKLTHPFQITVCQFYCLSVEIEKEGIGTEMPWV
jgi:hypothetical protein